MKDPQTDALHVQFFTTVLRWEQGAAMTVPGTVDGRKEGERKKERIHGMGFF